MFSCRVIDKVVDDLCRFSPQLEKAWKAKPTIHPERCEFVTLYMVLF